MISSNQSTFPESPAASLFPARYINTLIMAWAYYAHLSFVLSISRVVHLILSKNTLINYIIITSNITIITKAITTHRLQQQLIVHFQALRSWITIPLHHLLTVLLQNPIQQIIRPRPCYQYRHLHHLQTVYLRIASIKAIIIIMLGRLCNPESNPIKKCTKHKIV